MISISQIDQLRREYRQAVSAFTAESLAIAATDVREITPEQISQHQAALSRVEAARHAYEVAIVEREAETGEGFARA